MHWFPFYSSDFLGATVGLSCHERSIYALMIVLYFEVGLFPTERVRVYRIVGCESDEQKRAVDFLLETYFVLRDDGWYQEKAEKVKVIQAKNSEEARKKANERWEKYRSNAAAMQQHSSGNASHSHNHNQRLEPEPQPEQKKKKETPNAPSKKRSALFVLPDWLEKDSDVWHAWVEARTKAKHPPTDWAKQLAVNKLEHFREAGHNVRALLADAAFNNWQSFYPKEKA